MKSVTINNKTLELVEVPDGVVKIEIFNTKQRSCIFYHYANKDIKAKRLKYFYRILCKASEATEEQAREIVEGMIYLGYRDYSYKKEIDSEDFELCFKYNFYTATESLSSLIRSLGMEVEKTIILEKVK